MPWKRKGERYQSGLPTARQREVLVRLVQGWSIKRIARDLGICVNATCIHRNRLQANLGIDTLAGLVLYAIREGIIDLDGKPCPPPEKSAQP